MEKFLLSLRTNAWRTSGARYNASRRLRRRELFSTVSLAFFSTITIVVAFVQRVYATSPGSPLDNYLAVLSVCLGAFLLVISLMEWGSGNGLKADVLHRNAEELNSLQRKIGQRIAELGSGVGFSWEGVQELREEYENIKARCPYNHIPLDDLLFKANQRLALEFAGNDGKPTVSWCSAKWIWFQWNVSSVWYFGFFWVVILLLLFAPMEFGLVGS